MDIPKEKLLQIFVTESSDIILQLEGEILELEKNNEDEELIHSIFRAFHTIKGNAGMLGLVELKDFTHNIENLFLRIRKKEIKPDEDIITVILESIDLLKDFIENVNEKETIDKQKANHILKLIQKYKPDIEDSTQHKPDNFNQEKHFSKDSMHRYFLHLEFNEDIFHKHGIDPGVFVKDFLRVCEEWHTHMDYSAIPFLEDFHPHSFYLKWDILGISDKNMHDIEDMFIFVIDDNSIIISEINEQEYNERLSTFGVKAKKPVHNNHQITHEENIEQKTTPSVEAEEAIQKEEPSQTTQTENQSYDTITKNHSDDKTKKQDGSDLLKVKTDKVDKLMNLISELVISQARSVRLGNLILNSLSKVEMEAYKHKGFNLKEIIDYNIFSQFHQSINTLDRISREMQNGVLEIRMVPIGPTFNQFRRMVRDYSRKMGKEIDLTIKGEDTELDKNMIKSINDPLVHLIRNAIDHGIETREERLKQGKDPVGKLSIEAYQSEGRVVIAVTDDGKGLDKDRIYNRAIQAGVVDIDQELTDEDKFRLIFEPGLSTAKKITDMSGRGVGMDVVKNNVEKLKGKIDIVTEKGVGTTFKIILPLTLAIIDGMVVRVSDRMYIIPVLTIVSSYRPNEGFIKTVECGKDEIIKFRDTYIPLIRLNDLFDFDYDMPELHESLVIAVEFEGKIVGILVDELIGKQQIVMKGLEENYRNIRGISAATILGDGNVALIIDVDTLVQISQEKSKEKKKKRFSL
jgi:two-component system, chemotaxis family, sensor kinase CheA